MKKLLTATTAAVLLVVAGCMKDSPGHLKDIIVNAGESIQAAVNAAQPGQTILIKPGTYLEEILVEKANIKMIGLKGAHGERVIIQNPGDADNGITVRDAGDGFFLKNVTVRDYEENGVFLVRVDGFQLVDIETINNGEYGLFPVRCKNGLIQNCSATGHTDTGIYVGQSEKVAIKDCIAFGNVNGIEIENCSDIICLNSTVRDNTGGILVILLPGLSVKASANIVLQDNDVQHNNLPNFAPPGDGFEVLVPQGSGILVVGADNVTVKNNKVANNDFVGIAVVSTLVLGSLSGLPPEAFADIEPNADGANIMVNKLVNNGTSAPAGLPLPAVDLLWDGTGNGNCWKGNQYSTSFPATLPQCL